MKASSKRSASTSLSRNRTTHQEASTDSRTPGPSRSRSTWRNPEKPTMPTDPARRTTWPQAAALLIGFTALIAVGAWLVYTTGNPLPEPRPRPLAEPSKVVRMITFDRPFPPEGRSVSDPYIGSRICAECHPAETALHARSGHATTLAPAGRLEVLRRLDGTTVSDPEFPDVSWSYRYADEQLHITGAKRRATSSNGSPTMPSARDTMP